MLGAAEGFEADLVGLHDLLDQVVESLNGTLGEPLGGDTAIDRNLSGSSTRVTLGRFSRYGNVLSS